MLVLHLNQTDVVNTLILQKIIKENRIAGWMVDRLLGVTEVIGQLNEELIPVTIGYINTIMPKDLHAAPLPDTVSIPVMISSSQIRKIVKSKTDTEILLLITVNREVAQNTG